jgi:DNA modification methylase
MKLSEIHINPANPRIIKDDRIKKLVKSISEFPKMMELRPIIVDSEGMILGGNMRFKALKELNYKDVPNSWVKRADELTDEEKQRFIIEDNIGFGEWDFDLLTNEWDKDQLIEWGMEFPDFAISKPEAAEDDYEMPDEIKTDIVLGDLFEIGDHRLLCGDSTDSDQIAKLMDGEKVDITIQSPPYNVGKTPNGNKQKYTSNSDNKSNNEYLRTLEETTKNALLNSVFCFINLQSVSGNKLTLIEYLSIFKDWFCDYIIWDKMSAEPAMGENILNSRFEFVYVFGENAKRRIGVKKFRGSLDNIIFIKSRQDKEYSKVHKATYPVAFPAYFIENYSIQSCLDLFIGTGTTMVASHQLNRKCYGMEIDPKYCQVIIDRMRKLDPYILIKKNGNLI